MFKGLADKVAADKREVTVDMTFYCPSLMMEFFVMIEDL